MSRFEIGEIAWAIGRGEPKECEIMEVVPNNRFSHYRISVPTCPCSITKDGFWDCLECDLKKKKPPEDDASWEQVQEITGWNPAKEKVHA